MKKNTYNNEVALSLEGLVDALELTDTDLAEVQGGGGGGPDEWWYHSEEEHHHWWHHHHYHHYHHWWHHPQYEGRPWEDR